MDQSCCLRLFMASALVVLPDLSKTWHGNDQKLYARWMCRWIDDISLNRHNKRRTPARDVPDRRSLGRKHLICIRAH